MDIAVMRRPGVCHTPAKRLPDMKIFQYLTVGLVIFLISSTLASFVHKKTDNGFLTAAVWFGSAYLLFELALVLVQKWY